MAKNYMMKTNENDVARVEDVVSRFNDKLDSIRDNEVLSHKQLNALPTYRSVDDVLGSVRTRKHFNKILDNMEKFIDNEPEFVTNKFGSVTTRFSLSESKILLDSVNANKEYLREHYPVSTERGTMGYESARRLEDKKEKDFEDMYSGEYNEYVESLRKQARRDYNQQYQASYKENYFLSFDKNFNTRKRADEVRDKIAILTPEQLEKWYFNEGQIASPDFHYEKTGQNARLDTMEESLERFVRNNKNIFTKEQYDAIIGE